MRTFEICRILDRSAGYPRFLNVQAIHLVRLQTVVGQ